MRTKPFIVIQNGRPIFTVYARSIEQARAIVAAKIAGEVIVVAVSLRLTSPLLVAFDGAGRWPRPPRAACPRWPASQPCRRRSGAALSVKPWSSSAS